MRRETAAMYCDMTPAQFIREVDTNRMPQPIVLGGREMWSRVAIDETVNRLTGDGIPDWRAKSKLYAGA
jgi:predicted DNA-binding transcriptional regulator AlpA